MCIIPAAELGDLPDVLLPGGERSLPRGRPVARLRHHPVRPVLADPSPSRRHPRVELLGEALEVDASAAILGFFYHVSFQPLLRRRRRGEGGGEGRRQHRQPLSVFFAHGKSRPLRVLAVSAKQHLYLPRVDRSLRTHEKSQSEARDGSIFPRSRSVALSFVFRVEVCCTNTNVSVLCNTSVFSSRPRGQTASEGCLRWW